jgi:ferredoxin
MAPKRRPALGDTVAIAKPELDGLLHALATAGYATVGPRVQDNTIIYAALESIEQLPRGYVTEQAPGHFRLLETGNSRYFDFIPGGASWKQFLFPPRQELLRFRKEGGRWQADEAPADAIAYAFIGVRACELAAIQVQDRAFIRPDYSDATYQGRRSKVFILAVNCEHPAGTCFCATMGTGPSAKTGYDLCLTEIDAHFLLNIGSVLGRDMLEGLSWEPASAFHLSSAEGALSEAAAHAVCDIDARTCAQDIMQNLEHPHWEEVAKRCLSCANCTLVCPTCFCWDVTDQIDLTLTETRRERVWDSCFNPSYSYQTGGNTRPTIRSRYRQWLSHKFGSWQEQYGTLGCVGCGRCITWCPAAIDTRVEVAAIQKERKP